VLCRTQGTRIYVTHHDETGGPPNCATCAQERNRTRALGERPGEKERKIDEEQEAGVFHDVACAVYANWARVNARVAQDGI